MVEAGIICFYVALFSVTLNFKQPQSSFNLAVLKALLVLFQNNAALDKYADKPLNYASNHELNLCNAFVIRVKFIGRFNPAEPADKEA